MSKNVATLVVLALVAIAAPAQDEPAKRDPKDTGPTGVLTEEAFKALHELRRDQAPPPRGTMIALAGGKHYLSLPAGRKAPVPAVVVIHEWWGLNRHIKHWADRLAADGYATLAVDLYRGEVATTRDDAARLMRTVDAGKSIETLRAAVRHLREDPRVKAAKVGCVGWCFGGGWSLQTALHVKGVDAAVIYYGRLVLDPNQLATIKAPLLGIFGNLDRGIPPKAVDSFAAALKEAEVRHEVLRYDAKHAFANPSSGRYDAEAAAHAWGKVRVFFRQHLKGGKQ